MEEILQKILSKLENLEGKVNNIEEGQKRLETRFDGLEEKSDNLAIEFRSTFKQVSEKLDEHHEVILKFSEETQEKITKINEECGYFTRKIGEHMKEIDILKERIQS